MWAGRSSRDPCCARTQVRAPPGGSHPITAAGTANGKSIEELKLADGAKMGSVRLGEGGLPKSEIVAPARQLDGDRAVVLGACRETAPTAGGMVGPTHACSGCPARKCHARTALLHACSVAPRAWRGDREVNSTEWHLENRPVFVQGPPAPGHGIERHGRLRAGLLPLPVAPRARCWSKEGLVSVGVHRGFLAALGGARAGHFSRVSRLSRARCAQQDPSKRHSRDTLPTARNCTRVRSCVW